MRASLTQLIILVVIAGLMVIGYGSVLAQPPQASEETEQSEERMLEAMKVLDPKTYEQMKGHYELQEKINPILTSWAQKRIDEATAKTQLYPLVKAQIDLELKDIDEQIAQTKKHLERLEQLKRNPEQAIQERIKLFLSPIKPPDTQR